MSLYECAVSLSMACTTHILGHEALATDDARLAILLADLSAHTDAGLASGALDKHSTLLRRQHFLRCEAKAKLGERRTRTIKELQTEDLLNRICERPVSLCIACTQSSVQLRRGPAQGHKPPTCWPPGVLAVIPSQRVSS